MSGVGENPGDDRLAVGSTSDVNNSYYVFRITNLEQKANSGRHGHLGRKLTPRAPSDTKKSCKITASPRLYTIQPTQDLRVVLRHTYDVVRSEAPTIRQPPSSMHLSQDSLDRRSCDPDDLPELIGASNERR